MHFITLTCIATVYMYRIKTFSIPINRNKIFFTMT